MTNLPSFALRILLLVACIAVPFLESTSSANAQCPKPGFNIGKRTYPTEGMGAPIYAGDLNGDGKADAVFRQDLSAGTAKVRVVFGDGTGGFGPPTIYSLTINTFTIIFGDINGDGRADMITNHGFDTPSKVWMNNGSGVFGTPTQLVNTLYAPRLIADFNGDGKGDLVTGQGVVQLRLGDGTGNFAQLGSAIDPPPSSGAAAFAAGDFDGNGTNDLAISYLGSGNASKLMIATGDGAGNLFASTPISTGTFFIFDIAQDFNADSKPDLAGGNPTFSGAAPVVKILLNNGGASFTATDYPIGTGVFEFLQKGDFNGDGKMDLATELAASVSLNRGWGTLLLNNGTGGFTQQNIGKPAMNLDVVADFNNDGLTDSLSSATGSIGPYQLRTMLGTCARKFPINLIDYDGDGLTDIAVWRPSTAHWLVRNSGPGTLQDVPWGAASDQPAPGDFDGDGLADFAVFRPSEGNWYILYSGDHSYSAVHWGAAGDKPTPGDYDGDGKVDLCIYRPSEGTWYYLRSSDNSVRGFQFGISEDLPVEGDYDGDGATDISVFRPSTGIWYLLRSSNLAFSATVFGLSTDRPVPGDYDGDGLADIAVFRPSQSVWYILRSYDGALSSIPYGVSTDIPTPGDFSGRDGIMEIGVRRPNNGSFYAYPSSTAQPLGVSSDLPVITTNPVQ